MEKNLNQKIKWVEISKKKSERYEILSDFLNSLGLPNEFSHVSTEGQNLATLIEEAQKENQSIRFGGELWSSLNLYTPNIHTEFLKLKVLDSFCKEKDGQWWPQHFLSEAFTKDISLNEGSALSLDSALVIGSSGVARSAVLSLVNLGFVNVGISSESEEIAREIVQDFQRMFFNKNFRWIDPNKVTLLPGDYSVVVNTLEFPDQVDQLRGYYYFNFLKKSGVVVDLNEVPLLTPFIRIAKDINAHVVCGERILCASDAFWVQKVFGTPINLEEYKKRVEEKLSKILVAEDLIKTVIEEYQIKS